MVKAGVQPMQQGHGKLPVGIVGQVPLLLLLLLQKGFDQVVVVGRFYRPVELVAAAAPVQSYQRRDVDDVGGRQSVETGEKKRWNSLRQFAGTMPVLCQYFAWTNDSHSYLVADCKRKRLCTLWGYTLSMSRSLLSCF